VRSISGFCGGSWPVCHILLIVIQSFEVFRRHVSVGALRVQLRELVRGLVPTAFFAGDASHLILPFASSAQLARIHQPKPIAVPVIALALGTEELVEPNPDNVGTVTTSAHIHSPCCAVIANRDIPLVAGATARLVPALWGGRNLSSIFVRTYR
jgi:hypothetical protein